MNIFLSYSSDTRAQAERVCFALRAAQHRVFFDREELPAGLEFDARIRAAIDASELFVFLISPAAVAQGHYTRTELKIARQKWEDPSGHVLPVMVTPTPFEDIPAYLKSVSVLQPEGDLAAEVVMAVADLAQAPSPTPKSARSPVGASGEGAVHYRPIQLRFARIESGQYSLTVADSPGIAQATTPCAIDTSNLEDLLWSDAAAIAGTARRAALVRDEPARLPAPEAVRQVGLKLHEALFGSAANANLEENLRGIDPQRGEGLRFVIDTTQAPDLARLPWEFLYSPRQEDFLFSDRMKPVVRWLDTDAALPTLTVEPPLRMLIAIASPGDQAGLRVGEELAHLDQALAPLAASGGIRTQRLEHCNLERLDHALLQQRPHVLHFIGHGDFVGDDGVLLLEGAQAGAPAERVSGRQLGVLLRNHLASLRLVFLNSCMGATVSARDPFGGIAQSLLRRGVPAVIALQFPVPDQAAVALAQHFYRYLAAGQPVDTALTSARAFLFARGYEVEWGAPALYMRAPDGRLFDIAVASRSESEQKPAAGPSTVTPAPAPSTPAPRAPARKTLVIAAALVLLLIAAAVAYWLDTRSRPVAPAPANVVSPPAPAPAPPPAPARSPAAQAAVAIEQLESNQVEAALATLQALVDGEPAALGAAALGELHPKLAQKLALAFERELSVGAIRNYHEFTALLAAMEPFDAGTRAVVEAALAKGSEVAELLDILPAAGRGEAMTYTVQRGDTLSAIALRLTGDAQAWPRVVDRHNQLAQLGQVEGPPIANPNLIFPGQRILAPLSAQAYASGRMEVSYHVQRGDSLSLIAARIYGDAHEWHRIFAANKEIVRDPNLIYPGQVLAVPAL